MYHIDIVDEVLLNINNTLTTVALRIKQEVNLTYQNLKSYFFLLIISFLNVRHD